MSNRDREQNRDRREDDRQTNDWDDEGNKGTQEMGSQRESERGATPPPKPRKKK
jgi:hypothetical protein